MFTLNKHRVDITVPTVNFPVIILQTLYRNFSEVVAKIFVSITIISAKICEFIHCKF